MKLHTLLFLVNLLAISFVSAQNASLLKVYESPIYEDEIKTDSIQSIYTATNGNTGVIRNSNRELFFDFFNNTFDRLSTVSEKKEKKEEYIGDVFYNDIVHVFTDDFPERDKRTLSIYSVNLQDNVAEKSSLLSLTVKKGINLISNKKGTKLTISPDKKNIAIVTYTVHKGNIYYDIVVLDAATYEIHYSKQLSRAENQFFNMFDVVMDNEQNIFLSGESYYNPELPKRKSNDLHYFIVEKITKNDYKNLKLEVFEGRYIKTLKAYMFDGIFELYGFYSDKNIEKFKGTCYFSINTNSLEIQNKRFEEFTVEVYQGLFGENRGERKKGKELSNFKVNHILKDSQNNVYITAEEYYETHSSNMMGSQGMQMGTGRIIKHYDDVLVIKFKSEGGIDWGRNVLKRDFQPSYNVFLKNDQLHLVLNSGKNLRELNDGRTKLSKGVFETSALYVLVYNATGDVTIEKIQDNKDNTYYLPNQGYYSGKGFIMISESNKERRLMVLE